jgi:hypothetical protein
MTTPDDDGAKNRVRRRLAELVDEAVETDRRYFANNPHRKHRIRQSHHAEIAEAEIAGGKPLPAPPGFIWLTVVRRICGNARGRLFVLSHVDAEIDQSETACRELYLMLQTPEHSEMEAKILETVCREDPA